MGVLSPQIHAHFKHYTSSAMIRLVCIYIFNSSELTMFHACCIFMIYCLYVNNVQANKIVTSYFDEYQKGAWGINRNWMVFSNRLRDAKKFNSFSAPSNAFGSRGRTGGEILSAPKRRSIAHSLSCSPVHRPDMTEILLKGRKTATHPSILKCFLVVLRDIHPDRNCMCF